MLRFLRILPLCAVLLAPAAQAQFLSGPLPADASRTAPAASQAAARAASLSLPFFDDFTTPLEGNPRLQNWLNAGGALVSNRLGILPLSRGTASLDGLKANGGAYSGSSSTTSYGSTDTLTSQAIDLSGRSAASQLFLSYAWQSGSIIAPPNSYGTGRNVSLELQFKDQTNRWVSQWTQRSTGLRTPFRQRAVAVADPRYFHANFQFRFLASGDRTTGRDVWGLDYIYLNANRSASDTTFQDVATTTGLTNPLRRFTAMPWWQFNAAASPLDELNPVVPTNLTSPSGVVAGVANLDSPGSSPTPIEWDGTVRELTTGGFTSPWLHSLRSQAATPRRDTIRGNPRRLPLPSTAAAKRLRYTLALLTRETSPLTLPNDTLRRDVELADYYAYDDGTAENFTGISSGATTVEYIALRFDLNQPDQVRGLRLAPVFFGAGGRTVTIRVWADNNGQPGQPLGQPATATIPNPLPAGQVFAEIDFATSIPVSGSFFIGYGQPAQQSSSIGLDLNSTRADNSYHRTLNGVFHPVPAVSTPGSFFAFEVGAPMLRPVLTGTILASRVAATSPAFSLYPNPAHGTVTVAGPRFTRATVLDALGRTVWAQPTAETGQPTLPLPALPAGLYFVRLALTDGSNSTQRLLLE